MKLFIEHDIYGNLPRASAYVSGRFVFSLGMTREEAKAKLVQKIKAQLGTSPSRIREVEEIEI